jgi:DNA-binding transcriptional LysR family regulator
VAEEQNVTRAARRLRVAQPALSRTIRNLELEVGIVLLERVAGGVRLTPGGESFLPGARRALAEAAGAIARARDARASVDGPLIIAVSAPELRGRVLRRILAAYRRALPDVRVHIEAMGASAQWEALTRRAIDVGLAYTAKPGERPNGLVATPLLDDAFAGVAVSSKHRLARRKEVRLRELAHDRLILGDRMINPDVHDLLFRAFNLVGFVPRELTFDPKLAVNTAPTMVLVGAGQDWSLVPDSIRGELSAGVRYIPLADFAVPVTLQFLHRADDHSIRIRTFVRIARQLATTMSHGPAIANRLRTASHRRTG